MKIDKAPAENLDYKWDWNDFLGLGETISAQTVVAPGAVVGVIGLVDANRSVLAWISGGTLGQSVEAVCHITTSGGRQAERTIVLNVTKR